MILYWCFIAWTITAVICNVVRIGSYCLKSGRDKVTTEKKNTEKMESDLLVNKPPPPPAQYPYGRCRGNR